MPATLVKAVGSAVDLSGSVTAVVTLGGGIDVPAGHHVIIGACWASGSARTLVSVGDTRGNSYSVDRNVTAGAALGAAIARGLITVALQAGDTITLTLSGAPASCIVAVDEWAGLDTVAVDKVNSGSGTSTAPLTVATATTAAADELLIGLIGVNYGSVNPANGDLTPGASYTKSTFVGTSSGTVERAVWFEYRIVSATGAYVADGTLITSRSWVAAIATYRIAPFTARPRSFAAVIG